MRTASCSVRRIASSSSPSSARPPMRYSSAYPRMVVTGVRNSCEASATNWRSRSWDSSRASNADSRRSSIWLRAMPSSPASVPGAGVATR